MPYTSITGAQAVELGKAHAPLRHLLLVRVDEVTKRRFDSRAMLSLSGLTCDGLPFEATSFDKLLVGPPDCDELQAVCTMHASAASRLGGPQRERRARVFCVFGS